MLALVVIIVVAVLLRFAQVIKSDAPPPVATSFKTWYVSPSGNNSNTCLTAQSPCHTIGIVVSKKSSSGDHIVIGPGTYMETLSISKNLTLIGAGEASTIIDGGAIDSVLQVGFATLSISGVTIQNGMSAAYGGGISNYGTLTVTNSLIAVN